MAEKTFIQLRDEYFDPLIKSIESLQKKERFDSDSIEAIERKLDNMRGAVAKEQTIARAIIGRDELIVRGLSGDLKAAFSAANLNAGELTRIGRIIGKKKLKEGKLFEAVEKELVKAKKVSRLLSDAEELVEDATHMFTKAYERIDNILKVIRRVKRQVTNQEELNKKYTSVREQISSFTGELAAAREIEKQAKDMAKQIGDANLKIFEDLHAIGAFVSTVTPAEAKAEEEVTRAEKGPSTKAEPKPEKPPSPKEAYPLLGIKGVKEDPLVALKRKQAEKELAVTEEEGREKSALELMDDEKKAAEEAAAAVKEVEEVLKREHLTDEKIGSTIKRMEQDELTFMEGIEFIDRMIAQEIQELE